MPRKRPHMALFVLLGVVVLPLAAIAEGRDRAAEVAAAVSAFGRAYAEADVARLEEFLTRDYVHVNGRSGSVLSRGDWLRWVGSRRRAIESGDLVLDVYEIRDLIIRVHGEAAVATGEVESRGTENGEPFRSRVRFTNLWVVDEGRWRRAAFHDSPLEEEER